MDVGARMIFVTSPITGTLDVILSTEAKLQGENAQSLGRIPHGFPKGLPCKLISATHSFGLPRKIILIWHLADSVQNRSVVSLT